MKKIPLNKRGKYALVDDDMYEELSQLTWHLTKNGYAGSSVRLEDGRRKKILMHRYAAMTPAGMLTDHIDGDRLNNQRANLRDVTPGQNVINSRRKKPRKGPDDYRGVFESGTKYRARVCYDGRIYECGTYPKAIWAAIAYNVLARHLHGEHAVLNEILEAEDE